MTTHENRRRSRLVDRQFQVGLAWRIMLVFLMLIAGGVVLVFAPSILVLATGRDLATLEPAAREFLVLHARIWPAILVVLAGAFVYTIVLSHRIAGPVYRINSTLKKMIAGEYPAAVTLRRGDFLGETAELLQDLSRKLALEGAPRDEGAATRERGPA